MSKIELEIVFAALPAKQKAKPGNFNAKAVDLHDRLCCAGGKFLA
ncbi:MAG: hypothetical protein AB7O66_19815 [Limisphaerales bacterium]